MCKSLPYKTLSGPAKILHHYCIAKNYFWVFHVCSGPGCAFLTYCARASADAAIAALHGQRRLDRVSESNIELLLRVLTSVSTTVVAMAVDEHHQITAIFIMAKVYWCGTRNSMRVTRVAPQPGYNEQLRELEVLFNLPAFPSRVGSASIFLRVYQRAVSLPSPSRCCLAKETNTTSSTVFWTLVLVRGISFRPSHRQRPAMHEDQVLYSVDFV